MIIAAMNKPKSCIATLKGAKKIQMYNSANEYRYTKQSKFSTKQYT